MLKPMFADFAETILTRDEYIKLLKIDDDKYDIVNTKWNDFLEDFQEFMESEE